MMHVKVSKDKTLADGLIERTSFMLDEIESICLGRIAKQFFLEMRFLLLDDNSWEEKSKLTFSVSWEDVAARSQVKLG